MSNPDVPHLTAMISSHNPFRSPAVSAQNTGISAQTTGSNNPFLSTLEHGQQTLGRSQSMNNLVATPEIHEHGPTGPRPWDDGTPDSDSDDEDAPPEPTPALDAGSPTQPRSPSGPPPLPARTNTLSSPSTSSPPNTIPPPLPARRESTAQQASYAPPPGPPPTRATYAPPPGPPPGHRAAATQASRQDSLGPPPGSPPLNPQPEIVLPPELQNLPHAPDDLPPVYSSTANTRAGEETIDLGPRRPFQRAPPQPASSAVPASQSTASLNTQPTWNQPSRQNENVARRAVPPAAPAIGSARPSWQPTLDTTAPTRPRSASTSATTPARENLSDFAREFYAAGAGRPSATEGEGSAQPRYAPPPGPPPANVQRTGTNASASGSGRGAGSVARGGAPGAGRGARATADATPTTSPTPGRPLLNAGYTLEYPNGYTCDRCRNTGYKNYDPSHPCKRCWRRYSKPFSQLLALAPWGQPGSRYQRPLPNFTSPRGTPGIAPPARTPSSASASSLPRPAEHRRAVSSSASSRTPAPSSPASPGVSRVVTLAPGARAPPGTTTMRAGDPRLGGRLCWRCHGRGWHSFMIFDEVTCEECGGLGRTDAAGMRLASGGARW
ncbi:hypothetical protein PENSPDRAFT_668637 [Peniophora sp. CONT]|nr:hypothetical protein PENSPDRAFT_668637 [Peniophora sp. CONT]